MAIAGAASTALRLSAKDHDINGKIALETMGLVIQLHARMSEVERSLAFIATQVAKLPEEMRHAVIEGLNADATETLLGIVQTTRGLMADLEAAKTSAPHLVAKRRDEIRSEILLMRNARNKLTAKSNDLNAPGIFAALVVETNALSQLPDFAVELPSIFQEYEASLLAMLDEGRVGSLVQMRKALETQQPDTEMAIARAIVSTATTPLKPAVYDWFQHTYVKEVEEKRNEYCPPPPKQKYNEAPTPGRQYGRAADANAMLVATDDLLLADLCTRKVEVDKDVHTHTWKRTLSRTAVGFYPDLYKLELIYKIPTPTPGLIKGSVRHKSTDADYQRPFLKAHAETEGNIKVFNARAEAIAHLLDLELAASVARTLVARWSAQDADQLLHTALKISSSGSFVLSNISQAERNAMAASHVAAMKAAATNANRQIAQANDRNRSCDPGSAQGEVEIRSAAGHGGFQGRVRPSAGRQFGAEGAGNPQELDNACQRGFRPQHFNARAAGAYCTSRPGHQAGRGQRWCGGPTRGPGAAAAPCRSNRADPARSR